MPTTADRCRTVATDPAASHAELRKVAADPQCPPDALVALTKRTDPDLRSMVADNPGCPDSLKDQLAGDGAVIVRGHMARYDRSPERLNALAADSEAVVRRALCQNPETPDEALLRIARRPSGDGASLNAMVAGEASLVLSARWQARADGDEGLVDPKVRGEFNRVVNGTSADCYDHAVALAVALADVITCDEL